MEFPVSHAGRRGCRERNGNQARMMDRTTFKKVQVVYYLSRNGHLEHPHYMEVTHLAHQQLRLKDVMDRLTVLRGKGMPSLYSWSCKRGYKNGYVWNDLSENDVIYPSEGAEYVLKGSELIQGCNGELHHLQAVDIVQDSNFQSERSSLASKRNEMVISSQLYGGHYQDHEYNNRGIAVQDEYEEIIAPPPRCSRGVSTDDIRDQGLNLVQKKNDTNIKINGRSHELSLDCNSFSVSPPSTNSSTLSDKPTNNSNMSNNNNSKRSEDVDEEGNGPFFSRNSMLLSLIACGGSASFRKTLQPPKCSHGGAGSSGNLHKGVACKKAEAAVEEEQMTIGCMSENPRFGSLQREEKEYFSGSIVEAMKNEVNVEPGLKKSSSHNEERSRMSGLGEEAEEEVKEEKGVKGKCIPMKKSYTKQTKK